MMRYNESSIEYVDNKDCCFVFESMAFDGCSYYMVKSNRCKHRGEICKFGKTFACSCCSKLCKPISVIYYDCEDKHFWTTVDNACKTIYKMDCNYNFVDKVNLQMPCCMYGGIISISQDCVTKDFIIGFTCGVLRFSKNGDFISEEYKINNKEILSTVGYMNPYLIKCSTINHVSTLNIMYNGEDVIVCNIPEHYIPKSVIYRLSEDETNIEFDVLCTKYGEFNYIVKYVIPVDDFPVYPASCNFICSKDTCCSHCDGDCCCCSDIIKSIACVESALSHILNAEGEKIQKAVETATDIDELLCVNKSVQKTIKYSTMLEQMLYLKLDKACCCCDICQDDCCSDDSGAKKVQSTMENL